MASYPGSVKTFTTRNTGDVIQPGHVNDLQDEVNAIEAGLLNGTARLNSSNSTLVTLSVTGGSTITTLQAGASTVTTLQAGASTLASLSVSGGSTLGTMTAGASSIASLSVAGASTLAGAVALSGVQAAVLSTGNTDNFALASTASVLLLSAPAGGSTLTGISGGYSGRVLTVVSTSGNSWVLGLNNAGSSADCRIFGEGAAGSTTIFTLTKRAIGLQYVNNQWVVFAGQ
jgi:hypothetical protein